jgi:hypothetical protein
MAEIEKKTYRTLQELEENADSKKEILQRKVSYIRENGEKAYAALVQRSILARGQAK